MRQAFSVLLLLAVPVLLLPSCKKADPTVAVIIVKNEAGELVEGANVQLFADPALPLGDPNRLNKEKTSDAAGRAEFDYSEFYKEGQSGFAVLDILATKDTLIAEGIIKIIEEETTNETVILLPGQ